MNSFQDLARRVDGVAAPTVDVDGLIAKGEQQRHRRRMAAVLAAVAVAVVAMIVTVGYVAGSANNNQPIGPINTPNETGKHREVLGSVLRKIVYYDVTTDADGLAGATTVYYGDQVVDVGDDPHWFTFMDVTDDGFVYPTGDGRRLWFSDGGGPERIGSDICADSAGFPGVQVKTANAGSLVTWFDCSGPAQADLVVFDTNLGREVVRRPITRCELETASSPGGWCHPDAIIGDHVYFARTWFRQGGLGHVAVSSLQFDMATGRVMAAQSYATEIRSHPRGLIVGDSFESGTPTEGIGQDFTVVGSRLVPERSLLDGSGTVPTAVFDTATGRAVRLRLPRGYSGADGFEIFEWLDDETLALVGPTGWDDALGYGDILTCRLSDGRCQLTVRGRGPVRVTANGGHPG